MFFLLKQVTKKYNGFLTEKKNPKKWYNIIIYIYNFKEDLCI